MQSNGDSPGKVTATIVLAEDDADQRTLLAGYLRREGHEVWEACDGGEAVGLVRAQCAALLLLDIWMPVLNGLEVLEHLGRSSESMGMKVVVLSQTGDADTRLEGFALGVNDYWTKDLSLVELCADPTLVEPRADPAGAPGLTRPIRGIARRAAGPGPVIRASGPDRGLEASDRSPPETGPRE